MLDKGYEATIKFVQKLPVTDFDEILKRNPIVLQSHVETLVEDVLNYCWVANSVVNQMDLPLEDLK